MSSLVRLEACGFSIDRAHSIEQLEALSLEERLSLLIPTQELFAHLPSLTLPSFYAKLCRNGCAVAQRKLHFPLPTGERVRLYNPDGTFFALGEAVETEEGPAIKAIKIFTL
jgi:tRNA U55 pseudouridine synthase TruB